MSIRAIDERLDSYCESLIIIRFVGCHVKIAFLLVSINARPLESQMNLQILCYTQNTLLYPATKKCWVLSFNFLSKFAFDRPSVHPSICSFICFSICRTVSFKLCIRVGIGKEWFGNVDWYISSNKYKEMTLDSC